MAVWSFCPTEMKKRLETVSLKNKGTGDDVILYRELWVKWIENFSGCEVKKEWAITNGIHDALVNQVAHVHNKYDQFYWFDTDYKFYYSILQPYKNYCISPADISSIKPNSYILVSQPNHEGGITEWFEELKEHCRNTNSKIFLDCAFYGTTLDTLSTGDDIFDSVAFSLSKNFLLGGFRSGIIFSDSLPQTLTLPIGVHFSYNYFNTTAVEVAKVILPNFDATYITKHAKPIQVEYCKENGLHPADIWMWAFDKSEKICITEEIMEKVQRQLDISAKTI